VQRIIDRLMSQAYLFDDPTAYQAGVQDALDALRPLVDQRRDEETPDREQPLVRQPVGA
jgi:hypothetical protein